MLAQAILALKRAQAVDPANAEVMLSLGVSYTNELDQRRAVQFLGAWLALHPSAGVRGVAQVRRFGLGGMRLHIRLLCLSWGARRGTGELPELHA